MAEAAAGGGGQDEATRRRRPRGLGWIAVAVDYSRHPKMILLADELGDVHAPLYLPAVWAWFAEHFPEGTMPEKAPLVAALETAALWQGKPGDLVAGMVEVGLLERERGRLAVHDWDVYQQGHIDALARDRDRKRRMRAELRKKSPPDVRETSEDVPDAQSAKVAGSDHGTSDSRAGTRAAHPPVTAKEESALMPPSTSTSTSPSRASGRDGRSTEPLQRPAEKPNGSPPASERAGALSASASQVLGYLQKHRAGRQLIDISEDLGISLPSAEGAARELRTRALVEWVQLGRPPIATLRLVP